MANISGERTVKLSRAVVLGFTSNLGNCVEHEFPLIPFFPLINMIYSFLGLTGAYTKPHLSLTSKQNTTKVSGSVVNVNDVAVNINDVAVNVNDVAVAVTACLLVCPKS